VSIPKSFAAVCGKQEINLFLKSPHFQKLIRPAALQDLGAGVVAVPAPGDSPLIGVRVHGELLTFRESDMLENIAARIKRQAGVK